METKKKILLIVNMILVLGVPIIYTIEWSVISIAGVAGQYYITNSLLPSDINLLNKAYNLAILAEMGIYAILQLLSYIAFLFKCKRFQIATLVLSICLVILVVIDFFNGQLYFDKVILMLPLISNLIYLAVNKEEQKSKKKKKK